MTRPHFAFWPARMPLTLAVPDTTLSDNLDVTARRYPDRTAIIYYDQVITYRTLRDEVNRMTAYLMHLGVDQGDRVLIYMQNSPQYIISYYAIMRCGGIVVPINPMNLTEEISFYIKDGSVKIGLVSQELYPRIEPLLGTTCLERIILAAYSDYCPNPGADAPDFVKAPRLEPASQQVIPWVEAMGAAIEARSVPETAGSDLAVLPYTSGTTGQPKGCMHTHKSVQANVIATAFWGALTPESIVLSTLPLFHVTGMVHGMHTLPPGGGPMGWRMKPRRPWRRRGGLPGAGAAGCGSAGCRSRSALPARWSISAGWSRRLIWRASGNGCWSEPPVCGGRSRRSSRSVPGC
ncbi:AMP-binding protein [Paenibacillus thiaminolyticus]|uniref:AMP-binding protein n=1 Tax=Paenibacillus thiaminolyticus TaxID=49283 RepID=UPI0035A5FB4F